MANMITFVNSLGREVQVPDDAVDLISRLHRSGLRVLSTGNNKRVKVAPATTQVVVEPYKAPEFEFYSPFDDMIARAFHECQDIKDATEFFMVVQDIPEYADTLESECVRCWMYYKKREEWKQEYASNHN